VKHFTVDAGRNLDEMESTFTFTGVAELTAAIGIGKHPKSKMNFTSDPGGTWFSEWEDYTKPETAGVGTGLVLPRGALSSLTEDDQNHLALVRVESGKPLRYFVGAGWVQSGDFSSEADWQAYLAAFSARVGAPLAVFVN
jgi:pectinesterase